MINIIKMGQLPAPSYKTTCIYCNTIFTHFEADCEPFLPKNTTTKQIECPLCKNMVIAQIQKPPPDIPPPPPARSVKPTPTLYELMSDYIVTAKKTFRFNPKRN
jgi:hypothetical protein